MGKKARKTRWRTLTIADEHSDSEESNANSEPRIPKGYQHKSYYNRFTYSSQSTPTRRYQHDSTKSTRSSSTASENKITFNEEEYTKITTPRQDVLFKKGYLNKPKTYQSQTSTGTSTASTANSSTGNGTPDHQSTDLEYESQFVFPNGFVDQNGFYFVNSYEPYPLMLFNPPTYYQEFSNVKSKRCSTGSLTGSTSPNNEEATSQDLSQSGGEAPNTISDFNGHVYNVVYPPFYVNTVCPPQDVSNGHFVPETRRLKKRKRRKLSKSQTAEDDTTSEYTDDSADEAVCNDTSLKLCEIHHESVNSESSSKPTENSSSRIENETSKGQNDEKTPPEQSEINVHEKLNENPGTQANCCENGESEVLSENEGNRKLDENPKETVAEVITNDDDPQHSETIDENPTEQEDPKEIEPERQKYSLKPDAEEFIPRAYRSPDSYQLSPGVQYIKLPPNFVPVPLMNPMGDFVGQNFSPAFIPPGIPIKFIPQDPKLFQMGYVPNQHYPETTEVEECQEETAAESDTTQNETENTKIEDEKLVEVKHQPSPVIPTNRSTRIDIAKIVSKLEEAAKEQNENENNSREILANKKYERNYRQKYKHSNNERNFRRNNRFKSQASNNISTEHKINGSCPNSPVKETRVAANAETNYTTNETRLPINEDLKLSSTVEKSSSKNHYVKENRHLPLQQKEYTTQRSLPHTPERHKKIWRQSSYQSPRRYNNVAGKPNLEKFVTEIPIEEKPASKNYSETLKRNETNVKIQPNKRESQTEEQGIKTIDTVKKTDMSKVESVVNTTNSNNKTMKAASTNQWISVSSRKKRKNKNVEDIESAKTVPGLPEEETVTDQTDLFETYDVNLLVDVIPTTEEKIIVSVEETTVDSVEKNDTEPQKSGTIETEDIKVIDLLYNLAENEIKTNPSPIGMDEDFQLQIPEVSDIENQLLKKEIEDLPTAINETVEIVEPEKEIVPKTKGKKKSKKGTQKPLPKRVFITDIDLSVNVVETSRTKVTIEEIPDVVPEVLPVKDEPTKVEVQEEISAATVEVMVNDEKTNIESTPVEKQEKRSKKKKKKQVKTTVTTSSLSGSNVTLNVDDSYDFLLENSLLDESLDKTNLEVSQELDKMIQKGMYCSLEEKIKSLNIAQDDEFFKTVMTNISSRESSVEKSSFIKTPNISNVLKSTMHLFKPNPVSVEDNSISLDLTKITLPDLDQPSTSNAGFFLENPEVNEILQETNYTDEQDVNKEEETAEEIRKNHEETVMEENIKPEKQNGEETVMKTEQNFEKLYPITQAVKQWMNKTRETTPDVELLKSPSMIFKEFCEDEGSDSETETIKSDQKTLDGNSLSEEILSEGKNSEPDMGVAEVLVDSGEEVTIFTVENLSVSRENSVDLLECWENDFLNEKSSQNVQLLNGANLEPQRGCVSNNIRLEQAEDVLEVYESKYGKNEDFKKLKAEVEENMKSSNINIPKHGNLPYRAICCSIM